MKTEINDNANFNGNILSIIMGIVLIGICPIVFSLCYFSGNDYHNGGYYFKFALYLSSFIGFSLLCIALTAVKSKKRFLFILFFIALFITLCIGFIYAALSGMGGGGN